MPATHQPPLLRVLTAAALLASLSGCGDVQIGGGTAQVVEDFGIAYIKRPIPVEVDANTGEVSLIPQDVRELLTFNAGGDIYYRGRAAPSSAEVNITDCITGGTGDVRDLDVSFDGTKILFSLRLEDPNPNDDTTPSWNIYEYDTSGGGCPTRVISSDIFAEEGDDVAPAYLPDGRIVFSSTRQSATQKVLIDEGKAVFAAQDESLNEPAFVLHVMNADGSDIHQISFNQSHDLDPSVLSSGEILFTRWDHMGSRSAMNLYKIRPDGTGLKLVYGAHDHAVGTNNTTVQYLAPRQLEDGRVLTLLKPLQGPGDAVPALLDIANYADNTQPTWPNQGVLSGPAQSLLLSGDFRTDGSISPAGRFRGISPLPNGTSALVSWSQCRLEETDASGTRNVPCPATIPTDAVEAMPLYGIFLYNLGDQTALPVVIPQEGILVEEPVVAAPRDEPPSLIDYFPGFGLDQALADENVGLLHIHSVYDIDGGFNALGGTATDLDQMADLAASDDQRPARFLRILKATYLPDRDVLDFDRNVAFGRSSQQRMRELLGYAPIQPDGSVLVKVPANVPLAISVVDKDGRRIGARHQNWLQVQAGETLECNGCHDHTSGLPHGHSDAPTSINPGAPTSPWTFPGADPVKTGEMGETMAQARIRLACGSNLSTTLCPQLSPGLNPRYSDDWRVTPVAELNLTYADVLTGAPLAEAPTSAACQTGWNAKCRGIINYETSIHPLWSAPRTNAAMQDRTCTSCHNIQDAMGMAMVPAGQVDLSDGPSADEPNHFKSYRELFFADDNLILVGGKLVPETVDVVVPVVDGNGDPVFETDPVTGDLILDGSGNPIQQTIIVPTPVPAPSPAMSTAGSRFGRFMGLFLAGGSHAGDLSAAEIRLLSEWLDMGGQYFNDPFLAPLN